MKGDAAQQQLLGNSAIWREVAQYVTSAALSVGRFSPADSSDVQRHRGGALSDAKAGRIIVSIATSRTY
jgi:hypothetical protein